MSRQYNDPYNAWGPDFVHHEDCPQKNEWYCRKCGDLRCECAPMCCADPELEDRG